MSKDGFKNVEACESKIVNTTNQNLFGRYWGEDAEIAQPSGLVFISHGAGEHCLWYNQLATQLTDKNLFAFAHDHIGHGQSDGDRVHIDDFDIYVNDVFHHIEIVQKKFPDVPTFIIGHSMGGAIAIMAGLKRPKFFKGVVLIAPAITPSPDAVQPWKITMGRFLSRLCPQAPILKLDPNNVSRDEAVVNRYKEDPLVHHGGLKAKWGLCMINTLKYIEDNLSTITFPYLNLHGDQDKLVDIQGSEDMHEHSTSSDKTFKKYEGYYHQLHNEPGEDGAGVRQEIVTWITDRLPH
ncbi:hypothetical protein LOTGIDRAFT_223188 [Lottia gigantea]|uniref:Serine aminopeptidase S33 domain-containing protein n=1 Tax=Lottia gigantea TaxID=225164 RepID=V3ZJJ3_LOTGI|nr:hypothetical protein LOTGIDRAFT_223188 [Lottia gigantea]ESO82540.1 hypothetical protein LOTGIDRAFT_223188 [Lottia gigantea]